MISGIIMFGLGYFSHKYQDVLLDKVKEVVSKVKEFINTKA